MELSDRPICIICRDPGRVPEYKTASHPLCHRCRNDYYRYKRQSQDWRHRLGRRLWRLSRVLYATKHGFDALVSAPAMAQNLERQPALSPSKAAEQRTPSSCPERRPI